MNEKFWKITHPLAARGPLAAAANSAKGGAAAGARH